MSTCRLCRHGDTDTWQCMLSCLHSSSRSDSSFPSSDIWRSIRIRIRPSSRLIDRWHHVFVTCQAGAALSDAISCHPRFSRAPQKQSSLGVCAQSLQRKLWLISRRGAPRSVLCAVQLGECDVVSSRSYRRVLSVMLQHVLNEGVPAGVLVHCGRCSPYFAYF